MSTIDSSPAAGREAGRGDVAVRIGAVVFVVGTVATLATLTPFLIGADALPRTVYLLSLLMPLGLAVALGGLVATVRGQRRHIPD
ncbi:hypothetical protein LO772_15255 [Yinghuangia sp. ASG 101]|uniref:hypothetical protein n=1 Tax=Yinghuangia sp. ASG 101 TaxID=2896848 RepID=UPI001E64D23B|nr:hypothetical protein [Yinghuangia sp. ASG 101]UGQ14803.1 hypothetical protein LO772_15255 [Yinghuangia sp. ASG 101]